MPRTTFLALRAWVIGRGLLQSKRNTRMSLDQMLGIFLWMVGRNVHVRDAQSRFQESKSTIHHVFHNVLDALLYLYSDYVRTPPDHIPLLRLWTTGSCLSLSGVSFRRHNCSAMDEEIWGC